jgi:hypothetical protein
MATRLTGDLGLSTASVHIHAVRPARFLHPIPPLGVYLGPALPRFARLGRGGINAIPTDLRQGACAVQAAPPVDPWGQPTQADAAPVHLGHGRVAVWELP